MSNAVKRDPLRGMAPPTRDYFKCLPKSIQRAYVEFRSERHATRAAHRDQLEAFVSGYIARSAR